MAQNELLRKHYRRLCLEAGLRSAVGGLAIGFGVNFLLAALEWIFGFGNMWIAIGVWAGCSVVAGVLLYFLKFKPDIRQTARRVDRFGLDERMITMLEYEKDGSYIASLQRTNAKEHYEKVKDRKLSIRVSASMLIVALVAMLLGSSMTTVVALAEHGVIPEGPSVINPEDPYEDHIPVSYIVEEGGHISGGDEEQLVAPGGDADPIVAIADEGWVFIGWDDDSTDPARHDKNITEPKEFIAIFEQIDEEGDQTGDGEGPSQDSNEGDAPNDQPSSSNSNSTGGDTGENGEESGEEGKDGENDGDQDSDERGESDSESNQEGNGAGGKWEENNMIYNGSTYYKDTLEYYYELCQQVFEEHGEIPPELREFFELYYDSI